MPEWWPILRTVWICMGVVFSVMFVVSMGFLGWAWWRRDHNG